MGRRDSRFYRATRRLVMARLELVWLNRQPNVNGATRYLLHPCKLVVSRRLGQYMMAESQRAYVPAKKIHTDHPVSIKHMYIIAPSLHRLMARDS